MLTTEDFAAMTNPPVEQLASALHLIRSMEGYADDIDTLARFGVKATRDLLAGAIEEIDLCAAQIESRLRVDIVRARSRFEDIAVTRNGRPNPEVAQGLRFVGLMASMVAESLTTDILDKTPRHLARAMDMVTSTRRLQKAQAA